MARVVSIDIADDAPCWRTCGFSVAPDGSCRTGSVQLGIRPTAPEQEGASGRAGGTGVIGWTLAELEFEPGGPTIDGLPTAVAADAPAEPAGHANGVVSIDHIVVATPNVDRTVTAFEELGMLLKRRRHGESMGQAVHQAFFRLDEVVLEIAGPPEPDPDGQGAPARIWGLAFTVADLERTAAYLGDRLSAAREAVQPGRRIASLRRNAGLAVPVAFLTPETR